MIAGKNTVLIPAITAVVAATVWLFPPLWQTAAILVAGVTFAGFSSRTRVQPKPVITDDGSVIKAELSNLAQDFASDTKNQLTTSIDELERVNTLLRAAIETLLSSFNSMNNHMQAQRETALTVASGKSSNLTFT